MQAISVIFVVINIYWFCYYALRDWGIHLSVVDKILLNFNRTAKLFHSILWTKLFVVVFLALSCLGAKGVKQEKIIWNKIYVFLSIGFVLFFMNWWILNLPFTEFLIHFIATHITVTYITETQNYVLSVSRNTETPD